jgi:dTDP-4-dehydrorhamnose reductase
MALRGWVTGANGLVGRYLLASGRAWGFDPVPVTRASFDLRDADGLAVAFRQDRPSFVIHAAALSESVACERDSAMARSVNVEATARLAKLAAEIPLILFSSDLVFDGRDGAYRESAATNPLGIYAQTKCAAESLVLANPRHAAVRVSIMAGVSASGHRAFNEQLRAAWSEDRPVPLFTDEYRCPIGAEVVAEVVWEMLDRGLAGLYHLAGSERLSRYDIGRIVAASYPHLDPRLVAGTLRDYAGSPRPPDTSLDCGKLQGEISRTLPAFSDWWPRHFAKSRESG